MDIDFELPNINSENIWEKNKGLLSKDEQYSYPEQ